MRSGATNKPNRGVTTRTVIVAMSALGFTRNRSLLSHQWRQRGIYQFPVSNNERARLAQIPHSQWNAFSTSSFQR